MGLPKPLVFYFRDVERVTPSECLLNVFDFSGEHTTESIDMSEVRRRALFMDGFVLFLDPTQVQGKDLDAQIRALIAFHQEMRDIRGLQLGERLTLPVAVCISKLDLVVKKSPLAGGARKWLKLLRESFAKPVTLKELNNRSQLCQQVLPNLFPGFKLARLLDENFGGRFLFFPMTPVGLEESELGEEDLSRRTIAPVGILEPILWLLHMHGYAVFDSK
jgi:hypothetical protein